MLPVLIVCYLRPEKLDILLDNLKNSGRRVYVFIDRAENAYSELNTEVYETAVKRRDSMNIKIHWAEKNQGVGFGVPAALDWVFNFEKEAIILEDDCQPTEDAYIFFDQQSVRLNENILMACGTSPRHSQGGKDEIRTLSLASYPLIWGWSTNSTNWSKLRVLIYSGIPHRRVIKSILLNPSRVKVICFFYSASIRINRKKLKAWDSPVALEMLLCGYKAIIADKTLIQNSGQDKTASHFSNPDSILTEIVSQSEYGLASNVLDQSFENCKNMDKRIEKDVYSLKWRHVLSPIKALLGL